MNIPLSLAFVRRLIVQAKKDRYIVPILDIFETVRIESRDIRSINGQGEALVLREVVMPLFLLNEILGKVTIEKKAQEGIAIVLKSDQNKPFTIAVNDVLGLQQFVIKRLVPEIKAHRGIVGSTVLNDGKPCLILDVSALVYRGDTQVSA